MFAEERMISMPNLDDQNVIHIAKQVATANGVSFTEVVTSPVTDSTGASAIEVKIVLTPGSSDSIIGERSARTVSELIRKLADEGEQRFPIIRYEEKGGTGP
jgi:hypothetical protein